MESFRATNSVRKTSWAGRVDENKFEPYRGAIETLLADVEGGQIDDVSAAFAAVYALEPVALEALVEAGNTPDEARKLVEIVKIPLQRLEAGLQTR